MPPQLGREVQERMKVYGPLNELTYEGRVLTQTLQEELVSSRGGVVLARDTPASELSCVTRRGLAWGWAAFALPMWARVVAGK